MKKWKKCMSLLLAMVLCLCLAACGEKEEAVVVPDTIENLALNASVEFDYSGFLGTWLGEDDCVLFMEHFEELYNSERFELYDADGIMTASGSLQYVEEYGYVYAYSEQDGIAHRCWFENGGALSIDSFGTFSKVSGDIPGETIGDIEEEAEPLPDLTGYTGCWKMENEPLYFIINDACEWTAMNLYGEEYGPGYVVDEGAHITLYMEDGSEVVSLWQEEDGVLSDVEDNLLFLSDSLLLLPTPDDALTETAYFSDDFSDVSVNYPIQMTAGPHSNVTNSVTFNAVMEDGTDDYYTNVLLTFQGCTGYGPYMEKGAATAETYMMKMLDDYMNNMYGDYLIKSIGSDFEDNGSYYSITGYMWLDGSVFSEGDLTAPVRACMEVRYYGPTDYALVAITTALDSRIQNYVDICNNILDTISYDTGWSTAPKERPAQPGSSGDSGDYGTPYYWYDEDGDIWYWNGYENEFIGYGSNGYIDSDSGEYMESNDAGWDYDDYYYDDYDPWSDPGDGWDAWSDPGDYYEDGLGDYFG